MQMSLPVFNTLFSPDDAFVPYLFFFLLKMSPINSCPLVSRSACLPWMALMGL